MAAGGRRRSRRILAGGKLAGAVDADLLKPRGGIGDLIKPGAAGSAVELSSADSDEEAWIYVRGCRIKRAGLRFDSQGEVYVPDSEDEEEAANGAVDVQLPPTVAADLAAGVDLTPVSAADGASGVDLPPTAPAVGAAAVDVPSAVADDRVARVEMNPEVAAPLAKKVLGEDLHPDVAAFLAEVFSKMDPLYHECFIDMYKVMVPLFFSPPH